MLHQHSLQNTQACEHRKLLLFVLHATFELQLSAPLAYIFQETWRPMFDGMTQHPATHTEEAMSTTSTQQSLRLLSPHLLGYFCLCFCLFLLLIEFQFLECRITTSSLGIPVLGQVLED